MNRDEFIKRLFDMAAQYGGTAEACWEAGESFEVEVKDGEILSYDVSDGLGLGFRVLKDGHTGTASTQILDDEAVPLLVNGAYENAALSESEDEDV